MVNKKLESFVKLTAYWNVRNRMAGKCTQ